MDAGKRAEKLNELRAELSRLRAMIKVSGSIEKHSRVKEIRRAIARILTVENEERRRLRAKK